MSRPTWLRRKPKLTTEERVALLPPYGTVPYHQHYVRVWTRNVRAQWALIVVQSTFLATLAQAWYLRLIWVPQLVSTGMALQRALSHRTEHRQQAWRAETQGTLEAMSESGLFDMREAIEAMRDGPMPPGFKRKAWVEMHENLIKRIDSGEIPDGN